MQWCRIENASAGMILVIAAALAGCGAGASGGTPPAGNGSPNAVTPSQLQTPPHGTQTNVKGLAQLLPPGTHLSVTPTFTQGGVRFLAVDPDGTAYATFIDHGQEQLWSSTDNARTWQKDGVENPEGAFRVMTALKSGTLLADVEHADGTHALARSADHGQTWTDEQPLGTMTTLTPHSFAEGNGAVFVGEYQAFTYDSVPVHLWKSTDDGKTWALASVFTDRRHAHCVRVNPLDGSIWMFFGDDDQRTGIARSTNGGETFEPLVTGYLGSAVDAVFTKQGVLFGNDIVYGSHPSAVSFMGSNDMPEPMFRLPGPSYSIHATPGGGLVLGTTHEPGGDVYAANDDSAHLLASPDGVNWTDALQFPRVDDTGYARVDVYWTLPSGEMVVQLADVQPIGTGYGYQLIKVGVQH